MAKDVREIEGLFLSTEDVQLVLDSPRSFQRETIEGFGYRPEQVSKVLDAITATLHVENGYWISRTPDGVEMD